jgi:ABC-type transport system involved in multi-copper enzyme maturation permease subunit
MVGRIWAIALNTFREAARIRVLYGLVVLVIGANLIAVVLGEMSVSEEARVASDVGLWAMSVCGSLTAVLLGLFLLYNEVQRRTVHTIVSKPIERWEFVVGKWLGMALVLSVLVGLFAVAMVAMMAIRGGGVSTAIIQATLLAWMEVLTVAAIAIFFSSFSTPFLAGIFSLAMWLIGRLTPDIENATKAASSWIGVTARVALEVTPDFDLFSPSGRVIQDVHHSIHGDFVSWGFVGVASLHAIGWIVGLLALACLLFQRRDFV